MKSLLFILGCFHLIVCSTVQAVDWDKCGSGKQILQLRKLEISPDPISFRGKKASVSVQADLNEDIPSEARIEIKVWKVVWGFIYVPAQCFLPTGCNANLCNFLKYFSGKSVCPVRAGFYESKNTEFEIPDMSGFVRWFASGRFWVELKLVGRNSEQLSCWSFKGEAKALFSHWNPDIISMYMKNETSV